MKKPSEAAIRAAVADAIGDYIRKHSRVAGIRGYLLVMIDHQGEAVSHSMGGPQELEQTMLALLKDPPPLSEFEIQLRRKV